MRQATGSQKKILVVDDEEHIITYLSSLLEDNGYAVVSARDGEEALAIVRAEKPVLVTLDITMPKKSGVGFYRELRSDNDLAHIPVVVVTAVTGYGGDPADFEKFLKTRKQVPPPDAFVSKPFNEEDFLDKIAKILS